MRTKGLTRYSLPAALTGLLLLTACGSEQPGAGAATPSGRPVCGPGAGPSADASTSSSADSAGASAAPEASPAASRDGVTVIGTGDGGAGGRPCAVYSLTSEETEPFTYVVALTFLSESGQGIADVEDTVQLAPGRTVRRTVTAAGRLPEGGLPGGAAGNTGRVRITKVRSFPTAETPVEGGTCPPTGVRVYADDGDAAMGLRVVGLHLENCGTRPYPLHGYPRVEIRDEDHDPVEGVAVLRGGDAVATGTGADGPALSMVLAPGESAHAGLVWRNTVDGFSADPVNAPYARVWARSGAAPVTVIPEFDIGTTGKLAVGPWKKDDPR
ncbi:MULTISPECIES: DUF4232 domain-containing protein [unclassified Streptomyces]|uniref:DUF4232 domain-containing protein n=1 Tax=unclassified Streptomyces TaxID=2593676 RepID=UPI0006F4FE4A|nr:MULTISPECIES: DUF4232 domain-containing protein [unclassified Streptomyces]KQX54724.1 hypothetical protein ASD33_32450 [Streptomyces sp. Root1304]KRA93540.1 hypothetical protein ASE09_32235 [Streptomyces sp. Root66D1]